MTDYSSFDHIEIVRNNGRIQAVRAYDQTQLDRPVFLPVTRIESSEGPTGDDDEVKLVFHSQRVFHIEEQDKQHA